MASSRPVGIAVLTVLVAALVSTVAGDTSCFKDYAIGRLYKTKYDVCKGDNTVGSDYFQLMDVSLSAPYDRRVGRHVLFRNNQVGQVIVLSFYHPFRYCGTQPQTYFEVKSCWTLLRYDAMIH